VTSRILLLITPLVSSAQYASVGAMSQEPHSVLCGRVVAVSCTGPSSAATLLFTLPSRSLQWWIVIPPEHRQPFGSRIEDRYEQRSVCVPPATATETGQRVLVRHPDQIIITGVQASIPLPDDRLPILTRDVKPQYSADAMRARVRGSVVLLGIVDRNGSVRDVRVVQSLEPSLDAAPPRPSRNGSFNRQRAGGTRWQSPSAFKWHLQHAENPTAG
jgi:TonB family protein